MSRPPRALAAAAAALVLLAGAAFPAEALGGEGRPLRVTIAFTGDVSGYLEPCG